MSKKIEYKKDEPKHYPDFGQLMTPPVPMTEEHYLANIIYVANAELPMNEATKAIIHYARKAWDLVSEEFLECEACGCKKLRLTRKCDCCGDLE